MKNPTEPNLKTEWYPVLTIFLSGVTAFYFSQLFHGGLVVAFSRNGEFQSIPWFLLLYPWPIIILLVYLMFLLFPYFKINHTESKDLKDQWHKTKELSLSFLFIIQVVGALILSGREAILLWALPILLGLLLISFTPSMIKVFNYRKVHPLKLK